MPYDSPHLGGYTPRSDEGSKKLNELTELCTKLSDKVTSLEDDLKQTKKIYGKALTKLMKKVKHLEAKLKSNTKRRKARMVISDDEEDLVSQDTSKQGRMTEKKYEGFTLQQFTPTKVTQVKTYTKRRSTDSSRDSTAGGLFSTAEEVQGKEQISTDEKVAQKLNDEEMARKEQKRINFEKALELQKQLDEREETDNIDWNIVAEQVQERQLDTIKRYQTIKKKSVSVAQARKNMMIYLKNMAGYKMGYFKGMSYDEIRPIFDELELPMMTARSPFEKGKAILIEPEVPLKRKDQVALNEDLARNLQAQLKAKLLEEEKLARKKEEEANIALIESWDNTQAMMEADFELTQKLQIEEQGEVTIKERSRLFVVLMNKRKKHFAMLTAEEKRRKPPTKAQKRNQMSTYLKNMGGYKHNQLKSKSYEEI
ncbi:hypothetical protein Tco_1514557 [Tanacetum coccineum]